MRPLVLLVLLAGCGAAPIIDDDAAIDAGADARVDAASTSCAGLDCADWGPVLAIAPRDAVGATMEEAVANCVVQVHQSDCCGARRAYGVNHAARGSTGMPKLCHAESVCVPSYPSHPGCASDVITVDTGDTTTDASLVRVQGVPATPCPTGFCVLCQTVVCDAGDSACLALEGVNAMQCGS